MGKINFNIQGEFFYVISGTDVLILKSAEGEQIIKSRKITEVAKKIIEDPDILSAYEEEKIDINDSSVKEELNKSIENLKLQETLQFSDE